MDTWKDEAKYVLSIRQKDYEGLFRDDDNEHSGRIKHDRFVDTWGFSYNDMWDLGREIALFILPRLAYFRDHKGSVPGILVQDDDRIEEAKQKWDDILGTICDGLHLFIEKNGDDLSENEQALWHKAKLYLFNYFEWLWE